MKLFLTCLTLLFLVSFVTLSRSSSLPLNKLAIYFGWPSSVNLIYTISGAIGVFDAYDEVVFGAGLEESSHGDHTNTKQIINGTTADVFGYIDSTLSLSTIQDKVDKWKVMGGSVKNVSGIFMDQFGFDFGLTRSKQNSIVDYIHGAGLLAFVNAWEPDDVFKKSAGLDHHLSAGDWYLAESHYLKQGVYQSVTEWSGKSNKMNTYKSSGVLMACITTTTTSIGFNQTMWDNAHYAHNVYSFHSSGYGEPYYSASDALLPYRTRPTVYGTQTYGSMVVNGNVYYQRTNMGIWLDVGNRDYSEYI